MLLPQEGAGRAQRIEPRPAAAPLLNCPGPGQTDFGRFFESSAEKSFVRLDGSRPAAAATSAGQPDPGRLGRPPVPSTSCFRPAGGCVNPAQEEAAGYGVTRVPLPDLFK